MPSAQKRERSTSGSSPFRERELKLECDVGDIGRLLHHPAIADGQPLPQSSGVFSATYFDTPDQDLRRAGISLRIREHHGRFLQTIKADQGPRGIALDRAEWESEVNGTLDLTAVTNTSLQPLDDVATRNRLQPLFVIRTRRHAFLVEREGSAVELVLDRTTVTANARSSRFAEIELELKTGKPFALFAIAQELSDVVPLRLSMLAKSERGYRLLDSTPPSPVKSTHPKVAAGTTSAEAFQMVARETLSQIVQNEELLRTFGEAEALHQMRVGFRRLKTAMSLFKEMLAGRQTRAIKTDLRRAAKLLGEARDLDVLHESLLETDTTGLEVNLQDLSDRRERAYARLARSLEKPRFKWTLLRSAIWIEAGKWLTGGSKEVRAARKRQVEKLAAGALTQRLRRIRRDAKNIEALTTEKRHELRMRIKALRYGSEFFAHAFATRAGSHRTPFLKSLEQLQDVLGEMNDVAVHQRVFPALADSRRREDAARLKALMDQAKVAARKLLAAEPVWK